VLHVFPHWNWENGQDIDVWAYYNKADEVELFLNGQSLGTKSKQGDELHVQWAVKYEPGILKAVSRKDGKVVAEKTIQTAGAPAKIVLSADRNKIKADGEDLSFVTVTILDKDGNVVPKANNLLQFKLEGDAEIAALDNGLQTDLTPYSNKTSRKAFNGLALAIVKAHKQKSIVKLTVSGEGLQSASVSIAIE
jgi:beta-galactosidase